MLLLFEMSKPFDLLLVFVMDNNSFFSSAVRRYFQSLLAGCWPQFRFLKRRGAFRNSLKEMVFFYKTTFTLAKPCCQVHMCARTHTHTSLGFLSRHVQFSPGFWRTGAKP